MYRQSTLPNGLRILTEAMPYARSVSLTIFVGAGSRYESEERAGVFHFLEHLLFKGTQRRATARDISEAIEGVGGILNGGTDRELTIYWAKVARPHFALALDLLEDMLRHSKLEPAELEKERKVIVEELHMALDSPRERADMLIDELLWPGQALGRDVAGTEETIQAMAREDLLACLGQQYTPSNLVVSIAGDLDHEAMVTSLAEAFGDWPDGPSRGWHPARDEQQAPRLRVEYRKTEQANLCLAVHGLSVVHPDRLTMDLMNAILGEGMSSRLFQEIRETRGLAYDIHSYLTHFRDAGSWNFYAGSPPAQAAATVAAILGELRRLKQDGVSSEEVTRAREFLKGRLLLRMEDSRSVAGWLGSQELLTGRIRTVDEVLQALDAVTPEAITALARRLLVTEKLCLAVVGPFRSQRRFEPLLEI